MPSHLLKKKLVLHEHFLRKLVNCKKIRNVIIHASDKEIDFLLLALHYIIGGKIPVDCEVVDTLIANRHLKHLQLSLEDKADLSQLFKENRSIKVQYLLKVKNSIPYLAAIFFANGDDKCESQSLA